MATGSAVVAVGGMAVSLYANHKKSKAEQAALESRAAAKRLQAEMLLERFEENSLALKVKGKQFQGVQLAQFAKGGVDIGTGSPLLAIENTYNSVLKQIGIERTEANNKAQLLRSGADLDMTLAGDVRSAEKTQSAAIFLQGTGNAMSAYNKAEG